MKLFKSDKVFVISQLIASFVMLIATIIFKDVAIGVVLGFGTYFLSKYFLNDVIKES